MAPSIWSRTQELLRQGAEAPDLASLMKQGIGGTLLAVSSVAIGVILSAGEVAIQPMVALAGALADLAIALFGSPARIVIAGAQATAESLVGMFNVGPATFALAIGAVLAGLWLIGQYTDEEETGNLIPGLPFDVPIIGNDEEGES